MKPVFPNETRRERALFAARLHVLQNTELSAAAVRDVCEELLATVPTSAPIEPGVEQLEGAKR